MINPTMQRLHKRKLILITAVISLVYFVALATNSTPYLRGFAPFPQWMWEYQSPVLKSSSILPFLMIAVIVGSALWLLGKSDTYIKQHEGKILSGVFLCCVLFYLAVLATKMFQTC
jgi:hypothetical protein